MYNKVSIIVNAKCGGGMINHACTNCNLEDFLLQNMESVVSNDAFQEQLMVTKMLLKLMALGECQFNRTCCLGDMLAGFYDKVKKTKGAGVGIVYTMSITYVHTMVTTNGTGTLTVDEVQLQSPMELQHLVTLMALKIIQDVKAQVAHQNSCRAPWNCNIWSHWMALKIVQDVKAQVAHQNGAISNSYFGEMDSVNISTDSVSGLWQPPPLHLPKATASQGSTHYKHNNTLTICIILAANVVVIAAIGMAFCRGNNVGSKSLLPPLFSLLLLWKQQPKIFQTMTMR
jgi:hypothetical protein